MNLTVCPPCGPEHDSSVGEWMYLTVCPPCSLGHDSSAGQGVYLTVCPPCSLGHDSSAGEGVYLTVCPLHDPGHDSSVGEWISLSVLPVARSTTAPREKKWISLSVLPVAWVEFPATAEYLEGSFPWQRATPRTWPYSLPSPTWNLSSHRAHLLRTFAWSGFGVWNRVSDASSVPMLENVSEKCVFSNHEPRLRLKINSMTQNGILRLKRRRISSYSVKAIKMSRLSKCQGYQNVKAIKMSRLASSTYGVTVASLLLLWNRPWNRLRRFSVLGHARRWERTTPMCPKLFAQFDCAYLSAWWRPNIFNLHLTEIAWIHLLRWKSPWFFISSSRHKMQVKQIH